MTLYLSCFVAENPFGQAPEFYDLNVMNRQKFTVRPNGQSVRFRCEAKGDGLMTYTWLKNGKPLVFRNRRQRKMMDVNNHSLKIKKLLLADAGNYTCIASNKYGSVAFSFVLNMLRKLSLSCTFVLIVQFYRVMSCLSCNFLFIV